LFSAAPTLRGGVGKANARTVKRSVPMRARLARVLIGLSVVAAPAPARAGWTFCVAESSAGREVWITGVFAATRERERLEGDFLKLLKSRGVARPIAQCPAAKTDKTEMVNAQITAAEFHRKLGHALHDVLAPEFDPRR